MPELTPELVDQVVAACTASTAEAAEALGRALDAKLTLAVGEPGSIRADAVSAELAGPGLAVMLTVGQAAALFVLPEASGLLPSWYAAPDPTGQSKLSTLAQELGMLLLPESHVPDDFKAARAAVLSKALSRGGVAEGAALVRLELTADDGRQGTASLIWPAANPAMVLAAADKPAPGGASAAQTKPAPEAKAAAEDTSAHQAKPAPEGRPAPNPPAAPPAGLQAVGPEEPQPKKLPDYARSLLRVNVPVVVTLAEKRQPISRIVELGPGSIVQFDKSCEEMLELSVGGLPVAQGEAVKVGDKFGLRITSILLPDERFRSLRPEPAAEKSRPAG